MKTQRQDSYEQNKNTKDFSFFTKSSIGILGYRVLFDIQSLNYLSNNKQHYREIKGDIEDCQKKYQNRVLTIFLLSGALALSVRRYFPTIYSSISMTAITVDLLIASLGLSFGAAYASNVVQQPLNKIISALIQKKDNKMIQFIEQFQQKYKVSSKHLASIAAVKKSQTDSLTQIMQQQISHKHKSKSHQIV